MGNNAGGSYRTTTELMMRAFDKLSADVRQALVNADFNHVPQPVLTMLRRGDEPRLQARQGELAGRRTG